MPGPATEALTAYAAQIDNETNRIAAELSGLASQLANATSVSEVNTILQPVVDKLKATGTQPPVEPPPVEPPVEGGRRR